MKTDRDYLQDMKLNEREEYQKYLLKKQANQIIENIISNSDIVKLDIYDEAFSCMTTESRLMVFCKFGKILKEMKDE